MKKIYQTKWYIVCITLLFSSLSFAKSPPQEMLYGKWRITNYICPAICADTDNQASVWLNETFIYEEEKAGRKSNRCLKPTYRIDNVSTQEFLQTYRFNPTTVGITQKKINIIEISCNDKTWYGLGSTLIVINDKKLLTPLDGIYYTLKRVSS